MEKDFKQGKWIGNRPIVKHFNPDGVCATLVTEWLAAGGTLQRANFRRGTATSQSVRVVTSQRTDRVTVFRENGLFVDGQSQMFKASEAVEHVCSQPGIYYFKLCFKDGSGHAIGVINREAKCAVFDPNQGASESLGSPMQLKLTLMELVMAYMGLDLTNWAGVEVTPLRAMTLGEMAFQSQFV